MGRHQDGPDGGPVSVGGQFVPPWGLPHRWERKALICHAERSEPQLFAALCMTLPILIVKLHHRATTHIKGSPILIGIFRNIAYMEARKCKREIVI